MTIVITCGPAWEPLDEMRRLTNASTGRLGSELADAFAGAGFRVLLFRGDGATAPGPTRAVEIVSFGTNDDLAQKLDRLQPGREVAAVLHSAALCDFRVAAVRGDSGADVRSAKIPSRGGRLVVELEPATKILPRLREWFPSTRIIGWKFELNGTRRDAVAAARRQIAECRTDACVVNGRAWGEGFGICAPPDQLTECRTSADLAERLVAQVQDGG